MLFTVVCLIAVYCILSVRSASRYQLGINELVEVPVHDGVQVA